jgi:hypothetical protein
VTNFDDELSMIESDMAMERGPLVMSSLKKRRMRTIAQNVSNMLGNEVGSVACSSIDTNLLSSLGPSRLEGPQLVVWSRLSQSRGPRFIYMICVMGNLYARLPATRRGATLVIC